MTTTTTLQTKTMRRDAAGEVKKGVETMSEGQGIETPEGETEDEVVARLNQLSEAGDFDGEIDALRELSAMAEVGRAKEAEK